MPFAPKKPCSYPMCHHLVSQTAPCPVHGKNWSRRESQRLSDAQRGSSARRGYDSAWVELRNWWLLRNPICADPFGIHGNNFVPANVVDHIVPHKGKSDPLFRDPQNLRSLCKPCHDAKTAKFDGGFGNPKKAL